MLKGKYSINTSGRTQQHVAHKDDKGMGGGSCRYLRASGLPDFKPTEGVNKLNIIPFPITNPMYPPVKSGELEVGQWEVGLDILVHGRIGETGKDFLCLSQFGLPCPLCKETKRLYDEAEATGDEATKKRATDTKAKRRTVFIVQPIVKGEPGELKLWNASHFSFTGKLWNEANDNPAGGGPVDFANPEAGKVVYFRSTPSPKMKKAFDYEGIKFLERDAELDVDFEKIPSLDGLMIIPTVEDMEAALYGGPVASERATETKPQASQKTEEAKPFPVDPVTPVTSQTKVVDFPKEQPASSQAVATPVTPATTTSAASAQTAAPVQQQSSNSECPAGHKFGADNGMFKDCSGCQKFSPCLDAG